jgi:hypothetical protein
MADTRKLKVYEARGGNYRPVPEIILKGDWLKQYGLKAARRAPQFSKR